MEKLKYIQNKYKISNLDILMLFSNINYKTSSDILNDTIIKILKSEDSKIFESSIVFICNIIEKYSNLSEVINAEHLKGSSNFEYEPEVIFDDKPSNGSSNEPFKGTSYIEYESLEEQILRDNLHLSNKELAEMLNVSPMTISHKLKKYGLSKNMSPETKKNIIDDIKNNMNGVDLCAKYNVKQQTIRNIASDIKYNVSFKKPKNQMKLYDIIDENLKNLIKFNKHSKIPFYKEKFIHDINLQYSIYTEVEIEDTLNKYFKEFLNKLMKL